MAEFQFIINGELVTFDKYEDIPDEFEHVIKFNIRLQELMEKERASSN